MRRSAGRLGETRSTTCRRSASAAVRFEATRTALFARYSRTAKPLKRVFLDEFHRPEDDIAAVGAPEQKLAHDFADVVPPLFRVFLGPADVVRAQSDGS